MLLLTDASFYPHGLDHVDRAGLSALKYCATLGLLAGDPVPSSHFLVLPALHVLTVCQGCGSPQAGTATTDCQTFSSSISLGKGLVASKVVEAVAVAVAVWVVCMKVISLFSRITRYSMLLLGLSSRHT